MVAHDVTGDRSDFVDGGGGRGEAWVIAERGSFTAAQRTGLVGSGAAWRNAVRCCKGRVKGNQGVARSRGRWLWEGSRLDACKRRVRDRNRRGSGAYRADVIVPLSREMAILLEYHPLGRIKKGSSLSLLSRTLTTISLSKNIT